MDEGEASEEDSVSDICGFVDNDSEEYDDENEENDFVPKSKGMINGLGNAAPRDLSSTTEEPIADESAESHRCIIPVSTRRVKVTATLQNQAQVRPSRLKVKGWKSNKSHSQLPKMSVKVPVNRRSAPPPRKLLTRAPRARSLSFVSEKRLKCVFG